VKISPAAKSPSADSTHHGTGDGDKFHGTGDGDELHEARGTEMSYMKPGGRR